jgi:hypothetical protein
MTEYTYIMFHTHVSNIRKKPLSSSKFWWKALSFVLPVANPDFEALIHFVDTWLVECRTADGIPWREIGIKDNTVILKMPFKNNYGYWIDNNLTLDDFRKHFKAVNTSSEFFEVKWNELME